MILKERFIVAAAEDIRLTNEVRRVFNCATAAPAVLVLYCKSLCRIMDPYLSKIKKISIIKVS